MSRRLTPEEATQIRVKYRTEREFAVETKALDDNHPVSREELMDALSRLTHAERLVLNARLRRRLQRLDELMNGEQTTFDEPHVQHDDLVPEVTIPDYDRRGN